MGVVLSRRVIQRLLDKSLSFSSQAQAKDLCRRLNKGNREALDAEWELIVFTALASIGKVEYERPGERTRPDIHFRSQTLSFVADVRTVSDQNYDRENPLRELIDEVHQITPYGGYHRQPRFQGERVTPKPSASLLQDEADASGAIGGSRDGVSP